MGLVLRLRHRGRGHGSTASFQPKDTNVSKSLGRKRDHPQAAGQAEGEGVRRATAGSARRRHRTARVALISAAGWVPLLLSTLWDVALTLQAWRLVFTACADMGAWPDKAPVTWRVEQQRRGRW